MRENTINNGLYLGVIPLSPINKTNGNAYLAGNDMTSSGSTGVHLREYPGEGITTVRALVKDKYALSNTRVILHAYEPGKGLGIPGTDTDNPEAYMMVRTIDSKEHNKALDIVNYIKNTDVSNYAYVDIYIPKGTWSNHYYQ